MTGKIQTPPFGYLSSLGLKTSGQTPFETEPNLRSNYRTNEFYDTSLITTASATAAAQQVVGDSVSLAVPAGRAWRLLGLQLGYGPLGAGDDIRMTGQILWRNNSVRICSTPWIQNAAAGDNASWGFTFPYPFILLAGAALIAQLDQATIAAPHTLSIGALFVEYDV